MPMENSGFENGLEVIRCKIDILVVKIDDFLPLGTKLWDLSF
jgi:hypothetical protein